MLSLASCSTRRLAARTRFFCRCAEAGAKGGQEKDASDQSETTFDQGASIIIDFVHMMARSLMNHCSKFIDPLCVPLIENERKKAARGISIYREF
jgi:hypothetical protein